MYYSRDDIKDEKFKKFLAPLFSSVVLSIMLSLLKSKAYNEAISYVQALSTEELETLSEDLVGVNISNSDINEELSGRLNTLFENNGMFNTDEERKILEESVVEYLMELRNTNYDEYEMVLETLSDGVYDKNEVIDEFAKDEVIKKLNL